MIRLLIGRIFDFNYVCVLLLCYNRNITEDFIEDIIYVKSDVFTFNEWDNAHVQAVCDCAISRVDMNKNQAMVELYGMDRLKSNPVRMVFDINNFIGRPLSKKFNKKYEKFIKIPEAQVTSD